VEREDSEISPLLMTITNSLCSELMRFSSLPFKSVVRKIFFEEINTFSHKGCIQLITGDIKGL